MANVIDAATYHVLYLKKHPLFLPEKHAKKICHAHINCFIATQFFCPPIKTLDNVFEYCTAQLSNKC